MRSHTAGPRPSTFAFTPTPPHALATSTIDERARFAFLAETSRLLAGSLDCQWTLAAAARAALPQFGTWCVVDIVDPTGTVRRVSVIHPDPVKQQAACDYYAAQSPLRDDPIGAARLIGTSESELVMVVEHVPLPAVEAGAHWDPFHALGARTFLIVPMFARGRMLGAITFVSDEQRQYDAADLLLAEDLGRRCALALDNAHLYHDAEAARELAAYAILRADALRGAAESAREETDAANSAKACFLARMSHDLRTPLGVVLGHVGLLTQGAIGPVNGGQRLHLRRIEMATTHVLALIEEIIALSPVAAGYSETRLEGVDLSAVLGEACALLAPLAHAKGLALVVDAPDKPIRFRTDAGKFRQIVFNLASHAVTTTKTGAIRLSLVDRRDEVLLRVTDAGDGIGRADAERLFGSFWKPVAPDTPAVGTGPGLATTRQLVQLLGGHVALESSSERGNTFLVRLPRDRRPPQPLRHPATSSLPRLTLAGSENARYDTWQPVVLPRDRRRLI